MSGFIEGEDRNQATLFPERLDDYGQAQATRDHDEEATEKLLTSLCHLLPSFQFPFWLLARL